MVVVGGGGGGDALEETKYQHATPAHRPRKKNTPPNTVSIANLGKRF